MTKIDPCKARKLLNLDQATIVGIDGRTVTIRLRKYALGHTYEVCAEEAALITASLAAGHYERAA